MVIVLVLLWLLFWRCYSQCCGVVKMIVVVLWCCSSHFYGVVMVLVVVLLWSLLWCCYVYCCVVVMVVAVVLFGWLLQSYFHGFSVFCCVAFVVNKL